MKTIDVKINIKDRQKVRNYEKLVSKNSVKSVQPKKKKKNLKKFFLIFFSVLLGIVFITVPLVYKFLYLPAIALKDSVYNLVGEAKNAKLHFDSQDLVALQADLSVIEIKLEIVNEKFEYFKFAKSLPIVKGYYNNVEYVLDSAKLAIPLTENLITASIPIADVFGYTTPSGTHEEVDGQEKIAAIIRNLPDISKVLEDSESQLDEIMGNLAKIDPDYIPEKVGVFEIKSKFESVASMLQKGKEISKDIRSVLDIVPGMAGAPDKKTYLILFQNDKEIRPTGGFITAFGYAEIENGVLGKIVSEDIYNLDKKIYSWEKAPAEIQEYLGQNEWHIRDLNIHADLISTSEKFEEVYANQYKPRSFDGIIYIDTGFVEELMKVVGPIELKKYRETITADNVVDQLELYSEKILSGGADRKQFMEDLMGALVSRVIEARREEWGGLFGAVWKSLESKSIQFYFHDETAQSLASKYGFTGEIPENVDGDFFYIVEANMGGLKSNLYIQSRVEQFIEVNSDGKIIKTVKIHWENPEPKDYWLNGDYRSWIRIYVPKGSTLVDGAVSIRELNTSWNEKDYNKTIFETFISVPVANGCTINKKVNCVPGTYDLEFSYILPYTLSKKESYNLTIWKQPGKNDEPQTVWFKGKKYEFILDKNLEIKL